MGSSFKENSGKNQRKPRKRRNDQKPDEQTSQIGRKRHDGLSDIELCKGTGDVDTHAERRQEESDAQRGDRQNSEMQLTDSELRRQGEKDRDENQQGGEPFQYAADENEAQVAKKEENQRGA